MRGGRFLNGRRGEGGSQEREERVVLHSKVVAGASPEPNWKAVRAVALPKNPSC